MDPNIVNYCDCENNYQNSYKVLIRNPGGNLFFEYSDRDLVVFPILSASRNNHTEGGSSSFFISKKSVSQINESSGNIVCPFCKKVWLTVDDCKKLIILEKYASKISANLFYNFFKRIHKNLLQ